VVAFVPWALSRRNRHPLVDLRLFVNRNLTVAVVAMSLFAMAFFGASLLFPLYFQEVRGETALHAGLLLAPQGLGAAITMPISGRITDRNGPKTIVLLGIFVLMAATIPFALLSESTPYWLLAGTLFVRGIGLGMTMMPAMSAAYQTLTRAAVARATTALNIVQRVGGSIGTAVLAVVLQHQITARIPGGAAGGGLAAVQSVPAGAKAQIAPAISAAFAHTFWWALGATLLAVIPALMLPRDLPAPAEREDPVADAEPVATAA
jgi:predicted MFS family arabinose efflux permease